MDMDIEFDFESGFAPEDMDRRLKELLEEGNDELEALMTDVALETERQTRQRTPVQTGNLRASWESNVEVSRDRMLAEVFTNVDYAQYVELGIGQPAQPMLRPAVDTVMRRAEPDIMETVFRVAERVGE